MGRKGRRNTVWEIGMFVSLAIYDDGDDDDDESQHDKMNERGVCNQPPNSLFQPISLTQPISHLNHSPSSPTKPKEESEKNEQPNMTTPTPYSPSSQKKTKAK